MIVRVVDELKPGLVLAKAVYNHQELLLLEAGAKITEKKIRMFKSWGVTAVWVQGECPDDTVNDVGSEGQVREAVEIKLKTKFVDVLDNPIMLEIMRAASSVLSKRTHEQDEET